MRYHPIPDMMDALPRDPQWVMPLRSDAVPRCPSTTRTGAQGAQVGAQQAWEHIQSTVHKVHGRAAVTGRDGGRHTMSKVNISMRAALFVNHAGDTIDGRVAPKQGVHGLTAPPNPVRNHGPRSVSRRRCVRRSQCCRLASDCAAPTDTHSHNLTPHSSRFSSCRMGANNVPYCYSGIAPPKSSSTSGSTSSVTVQTTHRRCLDSLEDPHCTPNDSVASLVGHPRTPHRYLRGQVRQVWVLTSAHRH